MVGGEVAMKMNDQVMGPDPGQASPPSFPQEAIPKGGQGRRSGAAKMGANRRFSLTGLKQMLSHNTIGEMTGETEG